MKEKWDALLVEKRFRDMSPLAKIDKRNTFDHDYSRIISSPAIRRLQDKSQVFPLAKTDFIRTRLTHSLEVSAIAHSIGKSIEAQLLQDNKLSPSKDGYLSSLLSITGLIHDIGNPPFGHFGEKAIKSFFSDYFSIAEHQEGFSPQEINDFIFFDGNVQSFRILRRLSFLKDENSFNLSFPTLATIIKYPRSSISGNKDPFTNIADKKFGYFTTEEKDYLRISNFLKLENKRHPATYLLEAADDIAFSAADLEDGVKIGILDFDSIYNMFEKCLEEDPLKVQILQSLESNYLNCKDLGQSRLDFTVRNFRIFAQGIMIESVVKTFFENYDAFMSGDYPYEILDHNEGRNIRKAFKQLGRIVYLSKDVAEIELAGWKIINGLLHEFITAAESENFGTDTNSKENRIYSLISTSYRHIYKNYSNQNSDNQKYLKFQLVLDHISGMTDTYALKLYQRITGISI